MGTDQLGITILAGIPVATIVFLTLLLKPALTLTAPVLGVPLMLALDAVVREQPLGERRFDELEFLVGIAIPVLFVLTLSSV